METFSKVALCTLVVLAVAKLAADRWVGPIRR